jgi:hypothetical protein
MKESLEIYRKGLHNNASIVPNCFKDNDYGVRDGYDRDRNLIIDKNMNSSTKGTVKSVSKDKSARGVSNPKSLHNSGSNVQKIITFKDLCHNSGSKSVNKFAQQGFNKTKDGELLVTVNMQAPKTVRPFKNSSRDRKSDKVESANGMNYS